MKMTSRIRPTILPRHLLRAIVLFAGMWASGLEAQPRITEVTPATVQLEAGGRTQTVRLTVQELTEISEIRIVRGRTAVAGFQAAARRVALRNLRTGPVATFEVDLSAAASVAAGRYSVQLVTGRTTLALPLQLGVVAPSSIVRPGPGDPIRPISGIEPRLEPDRLALHIGCAGPPIHVGGTVTRVGETVFPQNSRPLVVEICATEGFTDYVWTLEGVTHEPYPGESMVSISGSGAQAQAAPHRFVVTIPNPRKRQGVRVRVQAKPQMSSMPAQGGRLWFGATMPNLRIAERPQFQSFWIENIRPGGSGRIENDGIFDAELTTDPSDGVFWVQGLNLNEPDLRIGIATGHAIHWATILDRTRSGNSDVVKAKVRDFRPGSIAIQHSGGSTSSPRPVKRLGNWPFPTPELNVFTQNIRCSLGAPRGRATLVLPNRTMNFDAPPIEGFGLKVDLLDMNSNAVVIRAETGGQAGREVVMTTQIDFETAGREFSGTFLPTVSWWACDTFRIETTRCATLDLVCFGEAIGSALSGSIGCALPGNWQRRTGPGPAVPVSGDLSSPRAIFRTVVGIDENSGTLVARRVDATFDAEISLETGMGTVPLGPLKKLILARANEDLGKLANETDFGGEFARLMNALAQPFGVGRLRHIGRLSDGRIYMEYERTGL